MDSALDQSDAELIIVDDGSTDGSKAIIRKWLEGREGIPFVDIPESIGNCAAFNRGFEQSSCEFVIDLAADDVLLSGRVEAGVKRLQETGAGVHYCNAELIDPVGNRLGFHNDRFKEAMPEGDLYIDLVARYLICPPTMMIKREVLERLGGYDETLAFEDFDFWVRSAREFEYCYSDEVLVKKRIVNGSHSASQNKFRNEHQKSILKVCEKILAMNRTSEEGNALKKRCWHEIRQCIKKGNLGLIPDYLSIIKQC